MILEDLINCTRAMPDYTTPEEVIETLETFYKNNRSKLLESDPEFSILTDKLEAIEIIQDAKQSLYEERTGHIPEINTDETNSYTPTDC